MHDAACLLVRPHEMHSMVEEEGEEINLSAKRAERVSGIMFASRTRAY